MPVIMIGITSPWCLSCRRDLRKAVLAVDGLSASHTYDLRANACWPSSSSVSRAAASISIPLSSFAVALADFFWHSQDAPDCCAAIVASARFRCCGRARLTVAGIEGGLLAQCRCAIPWSPRARNEREGSGESGGRRGPWVGPLVAGGRGVLRWKLSGEFRRLHRPGPRWCVQVVRQYVDTAG